jgi:hypothetical protein
MQAERAAGFFVGAILVIARWGDRRQQGEYKIRPYGWYEDACV